MDDKEKIKEAYSVIKKLQNDKEKIKEALVLLDELHKWISEIQIKEGNQDLLMQIEIIKKVLTSKKNW